MADGAVLGLFVGGASRRMGEPKGRLKAPGSEAPLVEHLVGVGRAAGLPVVLVGEASAYADLVPDVPRLPDDPAGIGPLGGLLALLDRAAPGRAVTVACDMPFVTAAVLERIVAHPSTAGVLAPRRPAEGPWEPMLARWDAAQVGARARAGVERGVRSFQALLGILDVDELPLDADLRHALTDWDTPEDVAGR